jgi:hypothetical protein
MTMFEDLAASGRLIDLILALMVAEASALGLWRWWSGRGPGPVAVLANLAAGACLMLALRAALTAAGLPAVLGWLSLALVAHLFDLALRLRA